ncbi:DUF2130 domain-containing protein [Paracrocinitomix mangrovi]|uniref:DUF2130 domain-containing protein n=1 Tax=Paracrocinitomix mangrovi TaxID=2862509 RepID=UPI001C8ED233|nr:DUF2130 domain-containing protein [Paracrocinitomix mangrovi]UKN01518.1 DUF2130 domain-containing protein [Paracrocinitomix mangrovi]
MSDVKITCPQCGHSFSPEDAIAHGIEEKLRKEFQDKNQKFLAEQEDKKKKFEEEQEKLLAAKKEFEEGKEKAREEYLEKLKKDKAQIEAEAKEKAAKEAKESMDVQFKALQEDLEKKKEENKKLQEKELEFMRKELALKEEREKMELEIQKQILEKTKKLGEEAEKKLAEKFELKEKEYQKQIEDAKKSAEEMKRKMEQGSMQLQGEVQELAIEDELSHLFPFDTIEEVSKGIRGADCIQTVVNSSQDICGKIIYESKRTQNFAGDWIPKLKGDMLAAGADIAVLITQTLPKEQSSFAMIDGVWVCSFSEFKSVAAVLRDALIRVNATRSANENKGDKMQMLYSYLTGNEFRHQVEAIVEAFSTMKANLDREKRQMIKNWKEREKQIDKVIENTLGLYGSVKGIAGSSVKTIEALEFDDSDDNLLDDGGEDV